MQHAILFANIQYSIITHVGVNIPATPHVEVRPCSSTPAGAGRNALPTSSWEDMEDLRTLGADGVAGEVHHVYSVRDRIGKGSFGHVKLGIHRETGKPHALKFVKEVGFEGEQTQWARECAILRAMSHPDVVKLHAIYLPSSSSKEMVIAMELCDFDLHTFLKRRAWRVSPEMSALLARHMCHGVSHCHDHGVLHRDLKPANMLIKMGDDLQMVLKISDFGSARFTNPARRMSTKTLAPMTLGLVTQWYRAPEFVFHQARYNRAVDIWSLGCVIGELLIGEPLLPLETPQDMIAALLTILGDATQQWPGATELPAFWPLFRLAEARKGQVEPEASRVLAALRGLAALAGNPADLVWSALRWNPAMRAPVKQLLMHPWLSATGVASPCSIAGVGSGAGGNNPAAASPAAASPAAAPAAAATPAMEGQLPQEAALPTTPQENRGSTGEAVTCACSGHCYTAGHRYRKGCDSTALVPGTSYCVLCVCCAKNCLKPRHHGPTCHGHGKVLQGATLPMRLTWHTRAILPSIMPCDMVAFCDAYSEFKDDLVCLVLCALLKEPSQVEAFKAQYRKLSPGYSGSELAAALLAGAESAAAADSSAEWMNLNRQGAMIVSAPGH